MSTRTPSPAWWSVAATRAAMHAVPAGPARTRWRRELVSELYGLGPAAQARHTVGVLVRAPALRAAVTSRDRVVEPAEEVAMSKPMKCHASSRQVVVSERPHYLVCVQNSLLVV